MSRVIFERLSSPARIGLAALAHAHTRTAQKEQQQTCRLSEINARNELSAGDKNTFGFGWRRVRLHIYFCSSLKSVSRGFARSSARAKHGMLHRILYPIFVSVSVANSGRQRVFFAFLGWTAEEKTITMAVLFLQLLLFLRLPDKYYCIVLYYWF